MYSRNINQLFLTIFTIWSEFLVRYEVEIRYMKRQFVQFHIWSESFVRYIDWIGNEAFDSMWIFSVMCSKISDFNRICSTILFEFIVQSKIKSSIWSYFFRSEAKALILSEISNIWSDLFCPIWSEASYLKQNVLF